MSLSILIIAAAALEAEPDIVVTGSREAVAKNEAPVSATVLDAQSIEALGLPALPDLLRLVPGASVSTSGPRGTQTQLRIRGAEANHTLLFVDGIRFNDPAAGNEARFELLTTDLLSRVELVRGPQSALWGSEALGGVVAIETPDPLEARGPAALAEQGSLDSSRLFGRYGFGSASTGFVAAAGWQRSDGVDSFGGGGERDGFEIVSSSAKAAHRSGPLEIGAVGHWIEGRSAFDGLDPLTFVRADTADATRNRIVALGVRAALDTGGWALHVRSAWLDSANRNRLAGAPLNATFGQRLSLAAQASRELGGHRLTAAVEHEAEEFRARDDAFFGATGQQRSRRVTALVAEWRVEWREGLVTDLAVRHDSFSAFADATNLRAAVLWRPSRHWTLHAAYGEGIAQPSFYDLYGFFPGSFAGNPALRPERSRGWEAGIRWENAAFRLGAVAFSARLEDEIVDVFDPATFVSSTENASGSSRRRGAEIEAGWRPMPGFDVAANYTFIDAEEQKLAGSTLLREIRRPRHSANLIAQGRSGRFSWGATFSWVGPRRDTDFDLFPARAVRLDDYALGSFRLAWRVLPRLELYGRIENGFDADYQDVVGYNTPGRTVHAGLRLALGR